MKWMIWAGLALISFSTNAQIAMDGQFTDWTNTADTVSDPNGDGSNIDFLGLALSSDQDQVFIKMELADELGLQDNNNLTLYIDTDNDPGTGQSIHSMGADLIWHLGQRQGTYHGQQLHHEDIGLVTAPTVTSKAFELEISRSGMAVFTGDSVRVLLAGNGTAGDLVPNNGSLVHALRDTAFSYTPISLEKEDTSFLRVMTYNVLFNGLTDPQRVPHFSRILQAVQPDVVSFNELFDTEAGEVKDFLDNHVPLEKLHGWYVQKVDYGNAIASRYPIAQSWEVYPGRRITAYLIDLPARFPRDLLAISAHLKCCNADETRQDEADAIAAFYRDIKNPGGKIEVPENTPFILLGDLNLVGDQQQLETLVSGNIINEQQYGTDEYPDWDQSFLRDLRSYHTDAREAFTWWDPESSFYPGRLDFMIYTESILKVEKHFLLKTEEMSAGRLQNYDLQQEDTRSASDHLPKVADFTFQTITGGRSVLPPEIPLKIYPNPAQERLHIAFTEAPREPVMVELFGMNGQKLMSDKIHLPDQYVPIGQYPAGIYALLVRTRNGIFFQKIRKQTN